MTPDIDQLREDINKAAHAAGTNAFVRDVLKRSHRALGDLRELSAVNESGCDRAMDMLEFSAQTCRKLAAKIECMKVERLKLDKRIRCQRLALRQNWEIIEMRASYKRAWYPSPLLRSMLRRHLNKPAPWWRRMMVRAIYGISANRQCKSAAPQT